ncbi:TolC family outer membrane protein [Sphingobium aquiterrae]|uniref:TolC family outer membrane protein n=1 Tax=Sphingobium aquiterrae TaxID=2038656 RepID=UPI00301B6391
MQGSNLRRPLMLSAILGAAMMSSHLAAADPVAASDADVAALTLESAVRKAVAWHPSVDQAIGGLNERGEDVKEARAGYSPQISGGVGSNLEISGGSSWRPRTTLSGSQMIYDFGKVASSVATAEASVRVSRAQLLVAVDNLVRNTAYAVVEVQRNRALLAVARDQLTSLRAIDKLVHYRTERGASTRSDALQAEARVQSAEATILQITAELHRWESNLRHLVGSDRPVDVTEDVPGWYGQACSAATPDWERVPAMMQYEAQREEALARYNRSKADSMPTLSLGADVGADVRDPFSNRSEVTVGFTLSSSLYQGGATRARRDGARYALQTAEAALAATRVEVGRNLGEAREQISSLMDMIATLGLRQEMMRETGKLYRLQYFEMGTRTLLDLLNAEQELHQVRFDQVNAIHDVRRLNTDCLYNSGSTRDSFALTGMTLRGVTL